MKGDTEIVLPIACFFVGILGTLLFISSSTQISVGDIFNPLATLVAAFMGAWAAFRLQLIQKLDDEKKTDIAAGNRALSTLMQQANILKLFQIDFIDPIRESPGRHIAMQPTLPYQEDILPFDFKSLDFLSQPKHQQTLFELSIEENRFREAIKTINARSRHHFDIVQPLLVAAGLQEGQEHTGAQFRAAIGELNYIHLKRITDAVVTHVDRTVSSLCSMKDRLREALSEQYPDGRFLNFELLNEPPSSIFSQPPS